ncbi:MULTISPECIES: PaaI family thioesterase [unclassified Sphingomonas]|jgi:uncharacterized protein (TIGR00369 family)|uniref:PaaI family thioesterase n=1 Tax=unclassified Sphingomonas TaxID=196159 RepID=UPI00083601D6|nr:MULTISPECIES: PaaI family thioesterase [unclassified Sphingomonas]MCH4893335.1 PaaI family thioesterase [Sphingomonas sp. SFZ2018-12]
MRPDADGPAFHYHDDPDWPGWKRWTLSDTTRFNATLGPLRVRVEDGIARVAMVPAHQHSNLSNHLHGGALLGFIDCALFGAGRALGVLTAGTAVTLDLSTQFIAAGRMDVPVEAQVELLRETGRLLFMRGLVVQAAQTIASFTATIRKPSAR